jgi:hypothetical protein
VTDQNDWIDLDVTDRTVVLNNVIRTASGRGLADKVAISQWFIRF